MSIHVPTFTNGSKIPYPYTCLFSIFYTQLLKSEMKNSGSISKHNISLMDKLIFILGDGQWLEQFIWNFFWHLRSFHTISDIESLKMKRDSHYSAGEGSFMEQQVFLHVVGISDTDCQLWEPWAKPQASHQANSHINFLPQVAPCGSTQTA